jgi:hypothetical protein
VQVAVRLEAASPDEAQELALKAESGAVEALGEALVPDDGRAFSHTELEPLDDEAHAALAADDLRPGISFARFEYGD